MEEQPAMAQGGEQPGASERAHDPEWLDALFGEPPEEEVGSVDELGWFGLVRHEGRPGGLVLCQDEQGFRHVFEIDSDQELQQRWSTISGEYERFYRQLCGGEAP